MTRPFVVTVASEKGGVGKTTIATNLAVYLKALREDLPVTIVSFDNHFSVDQMFALGARPQSNVDDLLAGASAAESAVLGQYGVQYVASARRLRSPSQAPSWLRQRIDAAAFPGILILDTRPILDWFTEAALLSAQLALVPIKDRAALVNADALRQVLADVERSDRLWLLPSLVDARARLNAEVRVHEFLTYAARERDYRVLDFCISKSPKVESLASGFSSCIRPVLTHARTTAVHGQFKRLAEFVLGEFDDNQSASPGSPETMASARLEGMTAGRRRRLVLECPSCCRQSLSGQGHFYFDQRSRRYGFLHPACFKQLAGDLMPEAAEGEGQLIALIIEGPGLVAPGSRLTTHLFDAQGMMPGSEEVELQERSSLADALSVMTGRSLDLAYREFILVSPEAGAVDAQLANEAYRRFAGRRRQIARSLRDAGLF